MSEGVSPNSIPNMGRVNKATSSFIGFNQTSLAFSHPTNAAYADIYDGPVPAAREIAQSTYTTYCELHRAPKHGSPPITKTFLIKNFLALLLSCDKRAAILCYDETKKINSICHPNHVPKNKDDFEKYFPHVYTTKGSMSIKCRITSSKSIFSIKYHG